MFVEGAAVQVIESKEQLADVVPGQVLSIGNFDGVHAGHQKILQQARETAERLGAPGVAVMTFSPHPAAVLNPDRSPGLLTTLEQKQWLLSRQHVDTLIVIRDTYEMLNLSPRDFVDRFLMRHIRPAAVVEGPNFNFGYGRSGDVHTLTELGRDRGFETIVVPPVETKLSSGVVTMVSSSMIRRLVEEGEVTDATAALSRPYRLIGRTVRGRGKGREIGFPTANIESTEQIVPAEGVYAGQVAVGTACDTVASALDMTPAAFSIGRAKTFVQDHALLIEAHLLATKVPDLTGKWLAMDFVGRVRHQQRFDSAHKLAEQITRDCEEVRRILGGK